MKIKDIWWAIRVGYLSFASCMLPYLAGPYLVTRGVLYLFIGLEPALLCIGAAAGCYLYGFFADHRLQELLNERR